MEPPWPVYAKRADVDELAVDLACAGLVVAPKLTTAERILAVRRLAEAGLYDSQIAERLKWASPNAVNQFRMRWRIPAGKWQRRPA